MRLAIVAIAAATMLTFANASEAEAGLLKRIFSRTTSIRKSTVHHTHSRSHHTQMRSDYRGSGRQPAYRPFYRYNAFFPGYNFTSPYGYDYR